MSENLKNCMKELKKAMSIKDLKRRKIILEYLAEKDCIYKALQEIAINILNENIKLKKSQIKRLDPHTKTILRLKKGVKKTHRKHIVKQTGGFLPWLLPIVSTVLGSL